MKYNRRQFLRQGTAAAVAVGTAGVSGVCRSAQAEEPATSDKSGLLPIIDTHQHLWDLDTVHLRWVKGRTLLNRSFVTKDYLEATRGLNVVKAVYMEVAAEPDELVTEAEYVIGLCRRDDNPTCAAVIGGRPAQEGFAEYLARFKGNPYVKGVRHIQREKGWLSDELVGGVRLLGKVGMSFDLCIPPDQLELGAKLVDRCPDTRFVLDHCGNADPKAFPPAHGKLPEVHPAHDAEVWCRGIDALARRKNVICKISGIVARAPKDNWGAEDLAPMVNYCLDAFGPDRVVFGGDWPVCTQTATFRQWVTALKEIIRSRPVAQQRKLLHDNAVGFYGLG